MGSFPLVGEVRHTVQGAGRVYMTSNKDYDLGSQRPTDHGPYDVYLLLILMGLVLSMGYAASWICK